MYQLLFAFMVTLVHMLFMSIYQPYRALDNGPSTVGTHSLSTRRAVTSRTFYPACCPAADYFTLACNFSLTTVFFFCVFLKVAILTEAVDNVMTPSLKSGFEMPSDLISVCLMAVVLSALVLVCILTLQRAYVAARVPTIRLVNTKASPKLTLEASTSGTSFSPIFGVRGRTSALPSNDSFSHTCLGLLCSWMLTILRTSVN